MNSNAWTTFAVLPSNIIIYLAESILYIEFAVKTDLHTTRYTHTHAHTHIQITLGITLYIRQYRYSIPPWRAGIKPSEYVNKTNAQRPVKIYSTDYKHPTIYVYNI